MLSAERGPRAGDTADAGGNRIAQTHSLPLFESCKPPHNGTETSRAAADRIRSSAPNMRTAILRHLSERGQAGATDEELQTTLGLRVQTETPRRGELVKLGLVRDSGRRRPTISGRQAIVWTVASGQEGGGGGA